MVKGHSPDIDDSEIQEGLRLYNLLESNVQIDLEDLTAKDLLLVNHFRSKIDKWKGKEVKQNGRGRRA